MSRLLAPRRLLRAVVDGLESRCLMSGAMIHVANGLDENGGGQPVPGSFRAAIVQANGSPGSTIVFDQLPSGTPIVLGASLPAITGAGTIIDGTTGPAGRVEVRGNTDYPFNGPSVLATDVVIEGLWLKYLATGLTLGTGSSHATIKNNYFGDVTNAGSGSNGGQNIKALVVEGGAHDNLIGGPTAADRNVISGNSLNQGFAAITIKDDQASGTTANVVEGNYIGVDPTGTTAAPNATGIEVDDAHGNTIQSNVISGNFYRGGIDLQTTVFPFHGEYGNVISGNLIGTDAAGVNGIPNWQGISMAGGGDNVTGNVISYNDQNGVYITGNNATDNGQRHLVASNVIAHNGLAGVVVRNGANRATISQNSIFSNGRLGISLTETGTPLPNSPAGGTTAAGNNGNQPSPVLSVADAGDGVNLIVTATLASNINTQYTIELFANSSATVDPSLYGQGQTYLASATLTTALSGQGSVTILVPKTQAAGLYLSATATNASPFDASANVDAGSTSEFSLDVLAPGPVVIPAATLTSLVAPAGPVAVGTAVTLTATVAPVLSGSPIPTGTITFSANGSVIGTVAVGSDGTAQLVTTTLPVGVDNLTAEYGGDVNFTASTAPIAATVVTDGSASAAPVSVDLAAAVLPVSAVAGLKAKVKVPVRITNLGSALKGVFTIDLFVSTDTTINGSAVLIRPVTKRLSIKAGRAATVKIALSSYSATLPNGAYYLIAQVTDPTGVTTEAASAQTTAVAAPFVALATMVDAVTPLAVSPGGKASVVVTLTNTGNVTASGSLALTLSPSADGTTPLAGINLVSLIKKAKIAPGKPARYKLKFRLPVNLPAGSYLALASASLAGQTASASGMTQFTVS